MVIDGGGRDRPYIMYGLVLIVNCICIYMYMGVGSKFLGAVRDGDARFKKKQKKKGTRQSSLSFSLPMGGIHISFPMAN